MRIFTKNILIFIFPLILLLTLLILSLDIIFKGSIEKTKISANINKLVAGDSHIKFGISDSILSKTLNIASIGEGFIYTYYKIKTLKQNNSQLDTIFLGVSFHSFSDYYNNYLYSFDFNFYGLPIEAQLELLSEGKSSLTLIKSIWDGVANINLKGIENKVIQLNNTSINKEWIGSFESYNTSVELNSELIAARTNAQYFRKDKERDFSKLQIIYFDKIMEYCKENNIAIILLNTPLHSEYKNKVPEKFKEKYYSLINNNSNLIEFDGLKFEDRDFLADGDHLSKSGVAITTNYLKEKLLNQY